MPSPHPHQRPHCSGYLQQHAAEGKGERTEREERHDRDMCLCQQVIGHQLVMSQWETRVATKSHTWRWQSDCRQYTETHTNYIHN